MQPLYPKLVTAGEADEMIRRKINEKNSEIIKIKFTELQSSLKHYDKIRRRYARLSNSVRIVGIVVGSLFGAGSVITGSLLTAGIAVPVVVPIALGAATIVEGLIAEGALRTYFKSRKHYFNKKCDIIKKYSNRIFLFEAKALEDQIITVEELKLFHELIDAYEREISTMKDQHEKEETSNLKDQREKQDALNLSVLHAKAKRNVLERANERLLAKFEVEEEEKVNKKYFRE